MYSHTVNANLFSKHSRVLTAPNWSGVNTAIKRLHLFHFVFCVQVRWISVNSSPSHMEPQNRWNKIDYVMNDVVWGLLRKRLWVPENIAISVRSPDNREWKEGEREYSLITISFVSEWKSSWILHCSQVMRETWTLAFSVGHHPPTLTSSLLLWYCSDSILEAIGALNHWWIIADKMSASNRPCSVASLIRSCFIHSQYQAVDVIVFFIYLFLSLLGNFSVDQDH